MTRAWLAALRLDFAAAFAYHPLFWVVPIAFALAFVREEVALSKLKRGIDIAVVVLCVLVVAVWIVRLINPGRRGPALWRPCARRSPHRYHSPRNPTLARHPSLLLVVTEDALEKRSTHKRGRTLR